MRVVQEQVLAQREEVKQQTIEVRFKHCWKTRELDKGNSTI